MKKFVAIYMLVFLFVFSVHACVQARDHRHNRNGYLSHSKSSEVAVDDVEISTYIGIGKVVESHRSSYGFWCEVGTFGGELGNLSAALLGLPNNKKIWLIGTSGLNEYAVDAWNLDINEFTQEFPQGLYYVVPLPHTDGFKVVNISYNFPSTPNVTSPLDGQTNVSLTPTITWTPLPGNDYMWIEVFDTDGVGSYIEADLDPGATSFTIPGGSGALKPNTNYLLFLSAGKDFGYEIESTRLLYFTTGN